MEERAVAEILHEVLALEERCHAEPLGTLVAHARETDEIADALGLHQPDHGVAPDAAADQRARLDPGARVVRAPAAEERRPLDRQGDQRTSDGRRWQRRETVVEAGRKAGPERRDQSLGVEDAAGGDQRLALVVTPADDPRALVPVVERIAYEPLERRVLLLDDDDLGEAVGELAHLRRLERHGHEQLEQADAGAADRVVVGEPEQLERLAHLEVRRAAGSDADPVVLAADRDPVEAVEHAVLAGELGAHLEELALHVERVRRHQPTVGVWHERLAVEDHRRDLRHDPVGVDVDGSRAVGHLADELDARPQPA